MPALPQHLQQPQLCAPLSPPAPGSQQCRTASGPGLHLSSSFQPLLLLCRAQQSTHGLTRSITDLRMVLDKEKEDHHHRMSSWTWRYHLLTVHCRRALSALHYISLGPRSSEVRTPPSSCLQLLQPVADPLFTKHSTVQKHQEYRKLNSNRFHFICKDMFCSPSPGRPAPAPTQSMLPIHHPNVRPWQNYSDFLLTGIP